MKQLMPLRTALILFLTVLVLAGCTLCPLIGGRRSATEPTPTAEAMRVDGEPTPEPTPDATGIERRLSDPDWRWRMTAAHLPPQREDIPLERRVTMLAEALAREVDIADETRPDQSYLTVGEVMRLRLVRSLGDLGKEGIPTLRDLAEQANGDARTSYLIALGYMGDKDVAPALREALQTAEDPVIRMDAARALGVLGDREAIPALRDALDDPYVAEGHSSIGTFRVYPVREQAAGALEALGVTVDRSGSTFSARP